MSKHSNLQCSLEYITQILRKILRCPKRSCKGTLIEVYVRYEPLNQQEKRKRTYRPYYKEYECSTCGKAVKIGTDGKPIRKPYRKDRKEEDSRGNTKEGE